MAATDGVVPIRPCTVLLFVLQVSSAEQRLEGPGNTNVCGFLYCANILNS